jgi:hypothetical protein
VEEVIEDSKIAKIHHDVKTALAGKGVAGERIQGSRVIWNY